MKTFTFRFGLKRLRKQEKENAQLKVTVWINQLFFNLRKSLIDRCFAHKILKPYKRDPSTGKKVHKCMTNKCKEADPPVVFDTRKELEQGF